MNTQVMVEDKAVNEITQEENTYQKVEKAETSIKNSEKTGRQRKLPKRQAEVREINS